MLMVPTVGEARVDKEEQAPVSTEEEKNKALVRRFFVARAAADVGVMDELLAPDFVDRSVLPGQGPSREDHIQGAVEDHAGISNLRLVIEDQVASGDKVKTRFSATRTHDRVPYLGIAPTGKESYSTVITIHRIEGGKIVEEWSEGSGFAELVQARLEQEIRERERIEQDLGVARRIQQASLPKEVPTLEGWAISPLYQPAREVGGDSYDFFALDDGRLGLVVGDATSKGVPAALVMSSARSMLRAVAQTSNSPGDLLRRVNDPLVMDIPPNMFVTCFYCILDPESGSLTYANAGHDMPYLRRRNGEAEELRVRGMPLGLMPGMAYEEKEIILEAGAAALFYSDGLVEAHDPKGEMFGFPRLRTLVAEHGEEGSLEETLLEGVYSFVGEG
jgi:predicted ester cyclase